MSVRKELPDSEKPKAGTVAELRKKFEKAKPAQSPAEYMETKKEAVIRAPTGVRGNVASYNLALRGAQVKAQRRATLQASKKQDDSQMYELMQFTEEFEDYPWHLAAMVDDDDAFWVPDLAAALETGDERLINEAVLRLFFEEHDQGMLNAVDALLDQHEGKEDELFEELQKEYIQLQLVHEDEPESQSGSVAAQTPLRRKSTVTQPPTMAESATKDHDEEKSDSPALTQEQKRRPSFIVSAMKKVDGEWAVNIQDSQLKEKMLESGADEKEVDFILGADKEKLAVDVLEQADV